MRILVVVTASCLALMTWPASALAQRAVTVEALDLYGAGAFELAVERSLSTRSLSEFTGHLLDMAGDQRPPEDLEPARLEPVAMALLLEVVMAYAVAQPGLAVEALERGCQRIRDEGGTEPFERAWQDAALAVLGVVVDPDALEEHLAHADRYYDTDRARLNAALAAEQRTSPGLVALSKDPDDDAAAARERLAALADVPSLRGEVLLRLGRLDVAMGDLELGLNELDVAHAAGNDPFVRYLSRLIRGLTLGQQGEWAEAQDSFRAALTVRPGAQSATVALANALVNTGARRESGELLDALVRRPAPAGDPWWSYWTGDVRFWLDRRDAMREATR